MERSARPFLSAQWRSLAMLNYEIDPALLHPFVPRGTELDDWNEKHYVSVVGFLFLNTKVLGVPVPRHQNFEEVNLRFYVRRKTPDGWRRGVVFVKEIVPRRAIALVANALYNEHYIALPMRHHIEAADHEGGSCVEYSWYHQNSWHTLRAQALGDLQEVESDSQEEFITEHYWGYARQRDGGCAEYRVTHPKWRVQTAHEVSLDCDVTALYGKQFAPYICGRPASAFVAEGSPVQVYRGVRFC